MNAQPAVRLGGFFHGKIMNQDEPLAGSAETDTSQPDPTQDAPKDEAQKAESQKADGAPKGVDDELKALDEKQAGDAKTDDPKAKAAEGEDGGDGDQPKPKNRKPASQRINEVIGQMRAKEREANAAKDEAARLRARLDKYEGAPPKESDYDSLEEYQAALAAHHVQKASQEERKQDAEDATKRAEASESEALSLARMAFNERAEDFAEDVPDFHKVVNDPSLNISEEAARQILHAEQGPAIAYFLGKNPRDAARLAQHANPMDVAREIGRIEGRLTKPKPRNVSLAPDPVKAIATGHGQQAAFNPDKASVDDVEAELKREGVI